MQAPTEVSLPHRFGWAVAAVLFGGSVVNYLDRAALGVLMPQVRRDLGLTNQEYAWAVNAFLVAYMISYVGGGRLADRLGCRRMLPLSVTVWSVAGMAHALVRNLAGLSAARALLGLGEAAFYPAAMRAVAVWFPAKERAKAVGLFLSALSAGTLIAAPVVAGIALRWGWRAAFLATGAVGFLLLPPWILLHRRAAALTGIADPSLAAPRETGGGAAPPVPLMAALRSRKYLCLLAARGCSDAAWYFYLFWLPGYFQEARGLDLAAIGRLLWIPYLTAGVGALAGAWLSSALIQRGASLDRGRKAVLFPSAAAASLGALIYFIPGHAPAIAMAALALCAHQSWSANIHTAISEVSPPAHVAVLYGISGAAGTAMGALAQLAIGPTVDAAGYQAVFAGAGVIYLAAAGLLAGAGRIEPVRG